MLEAREVRHLDEELEPDTQLLTPLLQDVEQQLSRDAREDVPAAADRFPRETDVDRIPDGEVVGNVLEAAVIRLAEGGQRAIGEDDAPAIRRTGGIALEDGDVPPRVGLLDENAAVQPPRAATENENLLDAVHRPSLPAAPSYVEARTAPRRSSWPTSATAGNMTSSSQPASS